jgi:ATP-dependent RNA helicase DDX49/DBP8
LLFSSHLIDGYRELAFQIAEQLVVLGSPLNARTAVIVGGMDMIAQAIELDNRPHVVVATPGRLVDHLRNSRAEWDLSRVKFLVCAIVSSEHVVVYSQILRF